jgi:acyl CoA:acetate/3-ketoacid CoA transferase beta subunit
MEFLALHDAVTQHVKDGDQVALEGFTHLIPFATGHECIMRPDVETGEMVVGSLHPGITREQVCRHTSWEVRFADTVEETAPPSAEELEVLRDLHARTARAHGAASGGE